MQWWITNQLAYKNNLYSINKNKEYEIYTLLRRWLRGGVWNDDSENWSQTIWKHKNTKYYLFLNVLVYYKDQLHLTHV